MNETMYFVIMVHNATGRFKIISEMWPVSDDGRNKAYEFKEGLMRSSNYTYRVCATVS